MMAKLRIRAAGAWTFSEDIDPPQTAAHVSGVYRSVSMAPLLLRRRNNYHLSVSP